MDISEIEVAYPDDLFGDEIMSGLPFTFVERYILQYSETLDDALSFIADVRRTYPLLLAVADGKLGTARMIQYLYLSINFFDDQNLQPLAKLASSHTQCCLLRHGLAMSFPAIQTV